MWKLVFRGRLERDASHEQAVEKLARLLKKSPEDIEKKLFSGRPVQIGTVATEDEAQQYKRAFSRAGAFLEVHEVEDARPETPGGTGKLERVLAAARSRTVRVGAGVCLLLVIVGLAVWYSQPVWRSGALTPDDRAAANALATDDLVMLGHLDVHRALLLRERLVSGASMEPLGAEIDTLRSELQKAGFDLHADISDIYAAYFADEGTASPAWIVLGHLAAEKVTHWLDERYDVDRVEGDRIYFTVFDEKRCEAGPMKVAYVFPGGALIAPMDRAGELVARWRQSEPAKRDLSGWHARQQGQLASLAIYAPNRARRALPGASGMLLGGVAGRVADVEAIYLGAEPTLVPPGINLSAAMESSNEASLGDAYGKARNALKNARESSEKSWPELVPLYERVEIEQSGESVSVAVRLDTDFGKELEDLATSFLSQAFGTSVEQADADGVKIDKNPRVFADTSEQALPTYSGEQATFTPQWKSGPFAAAVSSLAHTEDGLVVEIRVAGDKLLNIGRQSERVSIRIDDVTDKNGDSLLAKPECGPDLNREQEWLNNAPGMRMVDGEPVPSIGVAGSKSVQLARDVTPGQIAAITGEIRYQLPTRVSRTRVDAIAGGRVEQNGMRLYVQARGRSVGYQLSGNTDALLEIRALDKDGRYLAHDGSVWSDNLFGPGESGTLRFHGDVRQVEVIQARETKALTYPLLLRSPYPPLSDVSPGRMPEPRVGGWRQLDRAMRMDPPDVTFAYTSPEHSIEAGPALITRESLNLMSSFGLNARLGVYVPEEMPVAYNLAGGELVVERAILEDGTGRPWSFSVPLHFVHESGYWMNGEYRTDPDRPWLKASVAVSDPDFPFESVSGMAGRLVFRVPVKVTSVYLELPPGSSWSDDELQLRVSEWKEDGLYLDVDGDPGRLVAIRVLNASGERLGGNVRFSPSGEQLRLWVRLSQEAARLEVVLAEDVEYREQRFSLTPPPAEPVGGEGSNDVEAEAGLEPASEPPPTLEGEESGDV